MEGKRRGPWADEKLVAGFNLAAGLDPNWGNLSRKDGIGTVIQGKCLHRGPCVIMRPREGF